MRPFWIYCNVLRPYPQKALPYILWFWACEKLFTAILSIQRSAKELSFFLKRMFQVASTLVSRFLDYLTCTWYCYFYSCIDGGNKAIAHSYEFRMSDRSLPSLSVFFSEEWQKLAWRMYEEKHRKGRASWSVLMGKESVPVVGGTGIQGCPSEALLPPQIIAVAVRKSERHSK